MKKSMYSLMLMDHVVEEIDRLAYAQNTNRSNFINQILAEFVSIKTPEMHIKEIFDFMERQLEAMEGFKLGSLPSESMISMKSPLAYKNRPTIKYSVELYRADQAYLGELRIVFRTQHEELLLLLEEFFDLWMQVENQYLMEYFGKRPVRYAVESGKFRRTLMLPENSVTAEALSQAIGDYIQLFDRLIKQYLCDTPTDYADLAKQYRIFCHNKKLIL